VNSLLKKFLTISNFLLTDCYNIGDCLNEAKRTQDLLFEISGMVHKMERSFNKARHDYELFVSIKRLEVRDSLKRKGYDCTAQIVEDAMIKFHEAEYSKKKQTVERRKTDYDLANSLKMAMFQRKDLIMETIAFFRTNIDHDACILKNKEFIQKIVEAR
jgi:hypothetical protein